MNEKEWQESIEQIDENELYDFREANAILQITIELKKAKTKWPDWVYDPIHAASILCEEAGETLQAANDFCYSDGDLERLRVEACQAGAMAIRLLEHLDEYDRVRTYINQDNKVAQESNWFGYDCKWLSANWGHGWISQRYQTSEITTVKPEISYCNHPENKNKFEGNCNKKMCPLLNQDIEIEK